MLDPIASHSRREVAAYFNVLDLDVQDSRRGVSTCSFLVCVMRSGKQRQQVLSSAGHCGDSPTISAHRPILPSVSRTMIESKSRVPSDESSEGNFRVLPHH